MRKRTTAPEALWRDADLGIFNKPPDVIVYDVRGGDSFLSRIQEAEPGAQVCHRLDATTSGALLVSFSSPAQRMGTQLFEKRLVQKHYLVICEGLPEQDNFNVDAPLLEQERQAVTVASGGLPAQTAFSVVKRGNVGSLLTARPHTGRYHQIRAHLRHVGHPVMGDERYGSKRQVCVALHSAQLAFTHPVTGHAIGATAPVHQLFIRVAQRCGLSVSDVEKALNQLKLPAPSPG